MGKDKKYTLLDTDFIYKSHLARNAESNTLAELVLNFEGYEFFCHEMIKEELTRHEIDPDPNPWLEENVKAGRIKLYSDRDIVNELRKLYGETSGVRHNTSRFLLANTAPFFYTYLLENPLCKQRNTRPKSGCILVR